MPPVGFNEVPAGIRVPLVYIEWDNTRAVQGLASIQHKILVFGQRLATGSVDAGVATQITGPDQGDDYFGRGSMLANMLRAAKRANRFTEMWAIALDDDGAAVAASGSVEVTAAATGSGTIALYVAGRRVRVGVTSGDTTDAIATAINDAINADTELPVTSEIDGANSSLVNITARNAGEAGNDIDLRTGYRGEALPKGVTLTITAMSGGSANPDITTDGIPAMGDEWWNTIVLPYTDTANLDALATEMSDRAGPTQMKDGVVYSAHGGTHAGLTTFGDGRNDEFATVMATGDSPTPPWTWCAVNAAIAARSIARDPARPLQTLELPGILAPEVDERFTDPERNLLLHDGISTHRVASDGTVQIEGQITTYQENDLGVTDTSYLYVNTPATLSFIRFATRARITQKFGRMKLADDGTRFGAGQPIVTPSVIRSELLALFRELEEQGLVEGFEQYKEDLVVERDADDPNRVNVLSSPDLVNQLRVYAERTAFRV